MPATAESSSQTEHKKEEASKSPSPTPDFVPSVRLYLIRHGQSELNVKTKIDLIMGQSPKTLLTELGKLQAKTLGDSLKRQNLQFDAVYSSTAVRAFHTAELATQVIGYKGKIETTVALLEQGQGSWEGRPRKECYTPQVMEEFLKLHHAYRCPGGESIAEVESRSVPFIQTAVQQLYQQSIATKKVMTVAFFSHAGCIKSIVRGLTNSDKSICWRIRIEHTSLTEFNYEGEGAWAFCGLNAHPHLQNISSATGQTAAAAEAPQVTVCGKSTPMESMETRIVALAKSLIPPSCNREPIP
jgi:broad specificity phosphatase PhoE